MENPNKEYMDHFHNYIVAMVYYENFLEKGHLLMTTFKL